MRKKKAQGLSLQIVVIAAISIVILVVLIIIFREQIVSGAKKYTDIGNSAEGEIKGEQCTSFLVPRQCSANKPNEEYEWIDTGKKCDTKGDKCWERGDKIETAT